MTSKANQPAALSRRTALVSLGGFVAIGLTSCGGGGGGGGGGATPPAAASALSMNMYSPSASGAQAVLTNGGSGTITLWSNSGSPALAQALYESKGRKVRVFYDANGAIARIVDESNGQFVTVTVVNASRTEYNFHDGSGAWISGYAVLRNADGSYAAAPIVSSAALQGSQISGNLSGAVAASFSLLPDTLGGLGTAQAMGSAGTNFFALGRRVPVSYALLDRLAGMVIGSAHAQTVPPWFNVDNAISGALMVGGALLLGSGAGTIAVLGGVALMGYAAWRIYGNLKNLGVINLNSVSDKLLGAGLQDFSADRDAVADLNANVSAYMASPGTALAALPTFNSVAATVTAVTNSVASSVNSAATSTWRAITSGPPAGTTGLSGVMVDTSGTTYQVSGSYDPATRQTSFDTGPAAGTRIAGSTTGTGGAGGYTATTAGVASTGSFTVQQQALGACQTQQSSGGQGTFTNSYDLGAVSGTFQLSYEMFSIPDKLQVLGSSGQSLYSTGGLVSGANTVQIPYSGGRIVFVVVSAPTSGTAWNYSIGCPS